MAYSVQYLNIFILNIKSLKSVFFPMTTEELRTLTLFNTVESSPGINQRQLARELDVVEVYGLETKRINEAVKNNPDRFHLRTVSLRLPLPGIKATHKVVIYPDN